MTYVQRQLRFKSKGQTKKVGNNVTPIKGVHQFVDPKRPAPFENAKISASLHTTAQTMPDVKITPLPALVKDQATMNREMLSKLAVGGIVIGLAYLIWRG